MGNAALTNDTTPALDWADVTGANLYHAQVSLYSNFSSVAASDAALATSTYTPSALTTGYKYYWRWRSSTDSGSTWGVWSEVYSFWLDSSWSTSVTPSDGKWMFVSGSDITDTYTFAIYPQHRIGEPEVMRAQRRNLAGTLLTEDVGATKASVELSHDDAYVSRAQLNEILRFYHMATPFYLVSSMYNGTEYVERAWKVMFSEPPSFEPLANGREDHYRTRLSFEEV